MAEYPSTIKKELIEERERKDRHKAVLDKWPPQSWYKPREPFTKKKPLDKSK